MTVKRLLITGVTGFVGRNVTQSLLRKNYEITGIVRPKTKPDKLKDLSKITVVEIDLTDISKLKGFLEKNQFDVILHIGALRGGRKFNNNVYYQANVNATEQIAISAMNSGALLIFCSSVGVYGAIPKELPANIHTELQEDNYYHYTKILAEQIVQKMVLNGLKAIIIRPSIVYGVGDYGFPFTLTKLIHRKLFYMPDTSIRIHLTNIELLKEAFTKLVETDYKESRIYNIADREPVKLKDLVDYISNQLTGNSYPDKHCVSLFHFRKAEKFALRFGYDNFLNRVRLISYSWYYDVAAIYKELFLPNTATIPNFKSVTDRYKEMKKIKHK